MPKKYHMSNIRYNEKSWAIDLISEINSHISSIDKPIKRAGGENTVIGESESLFPDLLLFSSKEGGDILQGWELKFPDTPITDQSLLDNAEKKARRLKLNSFLIWNVTTAILYVADKNGVFRPTKTWKDLNYIKQRSQVEQEKRQWAQLLHRILEVLNDFFEEGTLKSKPVIESFRDQSFIDIILKNSDEVETNLQKRSVRSSTFDASVKLWWREVRNEHGARDSDLWKILANEILVSWIYKFIFAHILKSRFTFARTIEKIETTSSLKDAVKIFDAITKKCDFWNIFNKRLGEEYLTPKAWTQLTQLNKFLNAVQLDSISQIDLQQLLNSIVLIAKRKIAGQYATPMTLARLLVFLTLDDKTKITVDPCCGTGTIARASYDIKTEYGLSSKKALSTVWASDKFSFPVQISTLALVNPSNFGDLINVFKEDLVNLRSGKKIKFHNPINGKIINKPFPQIDYVVSNLPFVQQEDLDVINPDISKINDKICKVCRDNIIIPPRSDLYVYLPFYLWFLTKDRGRAGIIISNSWLGTDFGETFRYLLDRFFYIEKIVISGAGRWFSNSKVVTNILILRKRTRKEVSSSDRSGNEKTSFITLEARLENLADKDLEKDITSMILTGSSASKNASVKEYSKATINHFEQMGMEWSALFADLNWLPKIENKLIKVNELFEVNRGERRGWDDLFYPTGNHKIEKDYIKPVLKSSTSISNLITQADGEAFCCSHTIDELKKLKHRGALSWIRKFEAGVNEKGKPLPKVLARSNMLWYELKPNALADLVANINYDERIFIAKMQKRSFVNQRLTRLTIKNSSTDVELCHALLNSILSIFYLEAMGFGRGLGVLDLNSAKIKKQMFMLNPNILSKRLEGTIKSKFAVLLRRPILPIDEELKRQDRIEFDKAVLKAYELERYRDKIIKAFQSIYCIRKAVKE